MFFDLSKWDWYQLIWRKLKGKQNLGSEGISAVRIKTLWATKETTWMVG